MQFQPWQGNRILHQVTDTVAIKEPAIVNFVTIEELERLNLEDDLPLSPVLPSDSGPEAIEQLAEESAVVRRFQQSQPKWYDWEGCKRSGATRWPMFDTADSMQTTDRPSQTDDLPLARTASVRRTTGETDVQVTLNLDGTGRCSTNTGIPFLDHMLHQIASHGLVDLEVQATGDLDIDDHHTNEDVGITLGQALGKALGDRKGIVRFGHFLAPLDEALVQVVLDFSGRPHLSYGLEIPTQRVGNYDTQLVREFFVAIVNHAQMTLHIRQLDGINSHHIIEATFKAFARSLRMATESDPRRASAANAIPSSKGVL